MPHLTLRLTTSSGDTLGELLLEGVAIAAPGEISQPRSPGEMSRLVILVQKTVEAEGYLITQKPLDLQMSLSRALLQDHTGDCIRVSVPIREAEGGRSVPGGGNHPALDDQDDLALLDDLFDLENLEGERDA